MAICAGKPASRRFRALVNAGEREQLTEEGPPLAVRVTGQGDLRDPAWWSGTSAGLIRALERRAVNVDTVDVWGPRTWLDRAARLPYVTAALRHPGPPGFRETSSRLAEVSPLAFAKRSNRARAAAERRVLPTIALRGGLYYPGEHTRYVVLDDSTAGDLFRVNHCGMAAAPPRLRAQAEATERRNYGGAVACCAASRWTATSIIRDLGVPPDRVHVVGYGADPVPVQPTFDHREPRFLFVGMDWVRKNGDLVVDTFRRLRDDVPNARLDVVGRHPRLDVDGVTGHGTLSRTDPDAQRRLRELFRAATCFVMPSRSEGFGLVYVEAANHGVPSIGTTVGGAADAIGPGGVVVDPADPEQLLAAMRRMSVPAESIRLGRAAREHSALLTWDLVAARLLHHLLPGRVEPVADLYPVPDAHLA